METISSLIDNSFVNSLAWTLLHSIWQGAILLLSVYLAGYFIQNNRIKYHLYFSFYATLLLISGITFLFYYNAGHTGTHVNIDGIIGLQNLEPPGYSVINPVDNIFVSTIGFINRHSYYLVFFWTVGILISSFRTFFSGLFLHLSRRRGKNVSPEFYPSLLSKITGAGYNILTPEIKESEFCRVPVVTGFFKPVILLPIGMLSCMPYSYLEAIIAHELFHIIRKDHLTIFLQKFIEILYFFNPSVAILSGMINREREIICDDMTINLPINKKTYAKALAFFTETQFTPGYTAAALFNGKYQLYERIQRILGVSMKNDFAGIKVTVVILIVAAGFLFASSAGILTNSTDADSLKNVKKVEKNENNAGFKEAPTGTKAENKAKPLIEITRRHPSTPDEVAPPAYPAEIAEPATPLGEAEPAFPESPISPEPPAMISDSAGHTISFSEIEGIPYKDVKIQLDANSKIKRLWIAGKEIPGEKFDEYNEMLEKVLKLYKEEQARLEKSMSELNISMKQLNESMDKLKNMNLSLSEEQYRLQLENERMQEQSEEMQRKAEELQKESEKLQRQSEELQLKSEQLEKEADAHDIILDEMIKDGLVNVGEPFHIILNETEMFINNKKMPDAVREKYVKLYHKYFGDKLDGNGLDIRISD